MQPLPTLNKLHSYGEATSKKSCKAVDRPVPYCSSFKCAGGKPQKIGKKKDLPIQKTNCPDCGEALFWFNGKRDGAYGNFY